MQEMMVPGGWFYGGCLFGWISAFLASRGRLVSVSCWWLLVIEEVFVL